MEIIRKNHGKIRNVEMVRFLHGELLIERKDEEPAWLDMEDVKSVRREVTEDV